MADWGSAADWAQAVSSTVVLVLIYFQMRQVNAQMTQNDDQERFRRSWEFIRFYRDELRQDEQYLDRYRDAYGKLILQPCSAEFCDYADHFYRPRLHIFILLNHLIRNQDVDERVLYGYLEDDFNRFIEVGVTLLGQVEFKGEIGPHIDFLLTLWGSHGKVSNLLFTAGAEAREPSSG